MTDKITNSIDSENIITTEDGSHTLISSVFGERYHSIYGARTESQIVFINAGLKDKKDLESVSILEMGFGTGLNAYMTWLESENSSQKIYYTGYEKYPIDIDTAQQINYGVLFDQDLDFNKLHELSWNEQHEISKTYSFQKIDADIETLNAVNSFDVIFFDAFAPSAQEELWTTTLFQKMYDSLKDNGVLVTYCAKGYVKRNLKEVGFIIEPLAGPPGKREMTRARKVKNL